MDAIRSQQENNFLASQADALRGRILQDKFLEKKIELFFTKQICSLKENFESNVGRVKVQSKSFAKDGRS